MSRLAAGIYLAGVATVFGVRAWLLRRATGDSGHRFGRPPAFGAEWWAQILLGLSLVLGAVAPILAAAGVARPVAGLTHSAVQVAGLVVALTGFAAVVAAQHAMGRSWRVGVDPAERTELVTGGVFGLVRNPVFTAMACASAGLTAMVPSVPQFVALACLVAGVELQVRVVEEPYLRRVHGSGYAGYARRVGPTAGGSPSCSGSPRKAWRTTCGASFRTRFRDFCFWRSASAAIGARARPSPTGIAWSPSAPATWSA